VTIFGIPEKLLQIERTWANALKSRFSGTIFNVQLFLHKRLQCVASYVKNICKVEEEVRSFISDDL
jgi:hypothetical protein